MSHTAGTAARTAGSRRAGGPWGCVWVMASLPPPARVDVQPELLHERAELGPGVARDRYRRMRLALAEPRRRDGALGPDDRLRHVGGVHRVQGSGQDGQVPCLELV